MSKPREIVPAASSAGFEHTSRATPMGVEPAYNFASDEAAELWIAEGHPVLQGEPSGQTGYTVADVRAALKED